LNFQTTKKMIVLLKTARLTLRGCLKDLTKYIVDKELEKKKRDHNQLGEFLSHQRKMRSSLMKTRLEMIFQTS
jgi:hypothetical protein